MSRDIIIQPNKGTTGSGSEPKISFSGSSAGTINLIVEDTGAVTYEGDTGALFSITDNKDGLLSSVNDVSGLPIFSVYSDNRVTAGKWDNLAMTIKESQMFIGPAGVTTSVLHISGDTTSLGDISTQTLNSFGDSTGFTINSDFKNLDGDDLLIIANEGSVLINQDQISTARLKIKGATDSFLLNVQASTDRVSVGIEDGLAKFHVEGDQYVSGGFSADTITVDGGASFGVLTASTSVSSVDEVFIGVNDNSVARTITIQSADIFAGRIFVVKDEAGTAASANNITIATQGSELIDGSATATITADYGVVRMYVSKDGNLYTW